jgi:hypothetical protein
MVISCNVPRLGTTVGNREETSLFSTVMFYLPLAWLRLVIFEQATVVPVMRVTMNHTQAPIRNKSTADSYCNHRA